ncbi:MAG: metallophosphoesterase [Planctomycetaceae bacterium]|nr:metallophosphoesterase [Planctomycetaceae bacterium]
MKRAIISDIHSNFEALNAVLKDIDSCGIEEIICLGDTVGYGPDPKGCIDLMMERAKVCLLGNHDQATLFDPEGFNVGAEQAIFWTREQLEDFTDPKANDRWDFLGVLPRSHIIEDFFFVHGSPRNPLNEYVFNEDIFDERKMEILFGIVKKCSFQGHTHVPGIFTEDRKFLFPKDLENSTYTLTHLKAMVNVGSVGQPRDGDCRSCYVIWEDDTITYRRVEYDVRKTMERIYQLPVDRFLADRLIDGR